VAHDCIIGDNCVLANNATLAGHVTIGDYVILGGKTAILQFVTIGDHVITAGGSLVDKDVPPYIRAARYPISYAGINSVGLNRRGFSQESIRVIQDIYRYIFQKGYTISNAVKIAKEEYANTDEGKLIFDFIERSNVGLLKGYTSK
jgi:UDP-N-acetylglucosamine acyltransferase